MGKLIALPEKRPNVKVIHVDIQGCNQPEIDEVINKYGATLMISARNIEEAGQMICDYAAGTEKRINRKYGLQIARK